MDPPSAPAPKDRRRQQGGALISDTSTLGDYLRLVRRRKWIILQAAVLVPLAVLAFTLTQSDLYQGESQVLLNTKDATDQLLGSTSSRQSADELDRDASTQADVAHGPVLARRVLRDVPKAGQTPDELLDETTVDARSGSDLLTFKVNDPDPDRARALANAYAREYVAYRARLGARAIDAAKRDLQRRIDALGGGSGALADEYRRTLRRLETVGALQGPGATLVRSADEATKVRPRPVRNTLIGLLLGLVLGLALAALRDVFDRRVRSADDVASTLGLPLLARLPGRELKRRGASRLPLAHDPDGPLADAYRTLMYRLRMVTSERRAQIVMVTSAVEGEGKTTTAANLALALARAGQSTVLVELDLWRPSLHRLFGFKSRAGLAEVLTGRTHMGAVMIRADTGRVIADSAQNGGDPALARLQVLPAGVSPSHPSDLIALPALGQALASLRVQFEIIIVDAPPLVQGGDGIALAGHADALLIVTRLAGVRREGLQELRRRLADIPVPAIGVAVTDAERDDSDRWRRYYRADPIAAPGETAVH